MTGPASHLLQLFLSLGLVVPSSYIAGRVHQWYTHSLRRDTAFRQGYDHASRAMFDLAMRRRVATTPGGIAVDPAFPLPELPGQRVPTLAQRFQVRPRPDTAAEEASGRQPGKATGTRSGPF